MPDPNVPVIDTNPTVPANSGPVQTPPSPSTSSGGVVTSPVGGAGHQPSPDVDVDLSNTLAFVGPDGRNYEYPLQDLVSAKMEIEKAKASGYDLYSKALSGDVSAARAYLDKLVADRAVPDTKPPETPPQPALPPEWKEVVEYVQSARAQQVETGIAGMLKDAKYSALSLRPSAVKDVINQLHILSSTNVQITPPVVHSVLKYLNDKEKEYQDHVIKSRGYTEAGSLGVPDPFRGGQPETLPDKRPDPLKNPNEWKKWVGARWRNELRQMGIDREGANTLAGMS